MHDDITSIVIIRSSENIIVSLNVSDHQKHYSQFKFSTSITRAVLKLFTLAFLGRYKPLKFYLKVNHYIVFLYRCANCPDKPVIRSFLINKLTNLLKPVTWIDPKLIETSFIRFYYSFVLNAWLANKKHDFFFNFSFFYSKILTFPYSLHS